MADPAMFDGSGQAITQEGLTTVHSRFTGRKGVRLAASLAASLAVVAAAAATGIAPASAATASVPLDYLGDNCGISYASYGVGETCSGGLLLYHDKNGDGATASIVGGVGNLSDSPTYAYDGSTVVLEYYADYVFWPVAESNNDGATQGVRNNVESVSNTSSSNSYTLYVSPGYTGHSQTFGPNDYYANLNSQLADNEASVVGG
jgi:hypothetical protein